MGGKQMEGSPEQRRQEAKEARREGKEPSEAGATLGAGQQREESDRGASHEERMELRREGKPDVLHDGEHSGARPRSRDD